MTVVQCREKSCLRKAFTDRVTVICNTERLLLLAVDHLKVINLLTADTKDYGL